MQPLRRHPAFAPYPLRALPSLSPNGKLFPTREEPKNEKSIFSVFMEHINTTLLMEVGKQHP
jgi:hypothetical protein